MDEVACYNGDFIIAIGGGSVMDAAKLCSILKDASYTIKDLLREIGRASCRERVCQYV